MLYLIEKNMWLLLVVMVFAAVGGWAWHGLRVRPREQALQRERERLLRDVLANGIEGGAAPANGVSAELDREMDTLRRRADLDAGRVAEVERALEVARARAEEMAGRAAEAERALERATVDQDELTRLRAEAALVAEEQARTLHVEAAPAPVVEEPPAEDKSAAQAWRLRYFEQRVRYLESRAQAAPVLVATPVEEAPAEEPAPDAPVDERETLRLDWRARYAEARARHLEEALRAAMAAQAAPAEIADAAPPAEEDELSRWRMLYLEKRLAYVQSQPAAPAAPEDDTESDRLKWRAHYLEARVRALDAALAAQAVAAPAPVAERAPPPEPAQVSVADVVEAVEEVETVPAPLVPAGSEERPSSLPAAAGGASDDFTLIDGVGPMLQTTLNALGIYHFEQIANWTPANIAWVDQYLRLRGRISREEWVEQAADLAREGPGARRVLEDEMA
jgi:predicted flap endonuclease-1-like 5' DNA nuclease